MIYTWTKNIILTGLTGWTRSCCKRTEKNPEDPVDPPEADKSCLKKFVVHFRLSQAPHRFPTKETRILHSAPDCPEQGILVLGQGASKGQII